MGKRECRVAVKILPDGRYQLVLAKRPTKSGRIKKFIRGPRIKSLWCLVKQIVHHEYVFYGKIPCHWAWLGSMSIYALNRMIEAKVLFYSRKKPKYQEPFPF